MFSLRCGSCGSEYPIDLPLWRCGCGGVLSIGGLPDFDPRKVKKDCFDLWRYTEALPLSGEKEPVRLGEGCTPLLKAELKGGKILLKHEHVFPTGSFKDRGSTVMMTKLKEMGIPRVVEDSSGNAGASVAAYSAAAGIDAEIFVPESTSAAKVAQIEAYGASLIRIPGSREDTAKAAFSRAEDIYYASHSWNPFFFQGTKTFAYEVSEQLGWGVPDTVVLPCGNGTLLLGAYTGWRELFSLGIIQKIPRLIAVQSLHCAPLLSEWRNFDRGGKNYEEDRRPQERGIAEGIGVADPVRGKEILRAVAETEGKIIGVSDGEIIEALRILSGAGIFAEPTGAAALAGYFRIKENMKKNLDPRIDRDEIVVVPVTGHGLKTAGK